VLEAEALKQIFDIMEVTAVVLHQGALAHYTVAQRGKDRFVAKLKAYRGDPASTPPEKVSLEKRGRHCTGTVADVNLLDELYYAAREKLQERN
jgi:hypothetical protein